MKSSFRVLESTRSSSAPANQESTSTDPEAIRVAKVKGQSIQDRVVHLLALKPYKFNHLVQKLQRDGLTAREHKALKSVLAEVGVHSPLLSHGSMSSFEL